MSWRIVLIVYAPILKDSLTGLQLTLIVLFLYFPNGSDSLFKDEPSIAMSE